MSGATATAEDDDVVVEIIDDMPEADRGRPLAPDVTESDDDIVVGDDEISTYRAAAQKRIKDLSFKAHSERRAKEQALRERAELERIAQVAVEENKKLRAQAGSAEQLMVDQAKQRSQTQIDALKREAREALEAGDTAKFLDVQEAIARTVAENEEFKRYRPQAQPEIDVPRVMPPARPQLTERQEQFQKRNPWFDSKGRLEHDMTGYAFTVHHRLVEEDGINPDSDQYYRAIEQEVRRRFPEYWAENETSTVAQGATPRVASVVAPAARSAAGKPRTLRLTATQEALIRRLGITPKQYAEAYLKDQGNG